MTGYGPGAVIAWTAATVATLIVAAVLLHLVWISSERKLLDAVEANQQRRADRIAAAAFAASELAARQRHPTWPQAMPAAEVDRLESFAADVRDLYNDLDEWDRT